MRSGENNELRPEDLRLLKQIATKKDRRIRWQHTRQMRSLWDQGLISIDDRGYYAHLTAKGEKVVAKGGDVREK